jgi:serine/threonine protein kinase
MADNRPVEFTGEPFDRLEHIHPLSSRRRGPGSTEHARHQLYAARDRETWASVLVKVTTKPGTVYQHNLLNEIASLSTINRELPKSPYFPTVIRHGRIAGGRVYLVMSLFDEFPVATTIAAEPVPDKLVAHLRTVIEVAKALTQLHSLNIFHVDLNLMNILHRVEKGSPVIRIVDFESSYELARHAAGEFYSPPTTPGFSAPEVSRQAPDGRADIFSLGAVLYTMLAGYSRTWGVDLAACVERDVDLDASIKLTLRKALDPDPDARHATIQELHAALAAYLEEIWPGRSW